MILKCFSFVSAQKLLVFENIELSSYFTLCFYLINWKIVMIFPRILPLSNIFSLFLSWLLWVVMKSSKNWGLDLRHRSENLAWQEVPYTFCCNINQFKNYLVNASWSPPSKLPSIEHISYPHQNIWRSFAWKYHYISIRYFELLISAIENKMITEWIDRFHEMSRISNDSI